MDTEGNSPRGIYGGETHSDSGIDIHETFSAADWTKVPYTHYDTNAGEWWGMPRNQWGIEIPPAPRIPYLLWPIAIVGALLFAHAVNGMCSARR